MPQSNKTDETKLNTIHMNDHNFNDIHLLEHNKSTTNNEFLNQINSTLSDGLKSQLNINSTTATLRDTSDLRNKEIKNNSNLINNLIAKNSTTLTSDPTMLVFKTNNMDTNNIYLINNNKNSIHNKLNENDFFNPLLNETTNKQIFEEYGATTTTHNVRLINISDHFDSNLDQRQHHQQQQTKKLSYNSISMMDTTSAPSSVVSSGNIISNFFSQNLNNNSEKG